MSSHPFARQFSAKVFAPLRAFACAFFTLGGMALSLHAASDLTPDSTPDREQLAARFEEARLLYDAGQFDSAAALYEGLIELGYRDFALHYNLGNAHFKAGNLGPGILQYERARLLAPKDPDVLHNLELAYLRQADKRMEPLPRHFFNRTWTGWISLFSQTTWAWLTIAVAWSMLIGFSPIWWSAQLLWRRAGLMVVFVGFFALVLALSGAFGRQSLDAHERYAIIMAPSTLLKSAPSQESTDLYILREGFKLKMTNRTGNWVEVTLPDGNVAWVEATSIEAI